MEYLRTLTREFEVGEQADLRVENRAGSVAVHGEDTRQVRIEVVAHLWANSDHEAVEQLALIQRNIHQDRAPLMVRPPRLLRPGGSPPTFVPGPLVGSHPSTTQPQGPASDPRGEEGQSCLGRSVWGERGIAPGRNAVGLTGAMAGG